METKNPFEELCGDLCFLLEYNEEKGIWHYNQIYGNKLRDEPDTYGFASIAVTRNAKAKAFTDMMDCKLHRREAAGLSPYKTEHIKKEWKHFCYVYNFFVKYLEVTQKEKAFVNNNFDSAESLARLGHGSFSDVKEDKDMSWAWEYNPLDFKDSNF